MLEANDWTDGELGRFASIFFGDSHPQNRNGYSVCLRKSRCWFQTFFYVHPYLGKWSNLTNIFQMGWNHQLEILDSSGQIDFPQKSRVKLSQTNPWDFFFMQGVTYTPNVSHVILWWMVLKRVSIGAILAHSHHLHILRSYCFWKKSCTTWDG